MSKVFKSFKEESMRNWGKTIEEGSEIDREQIVTGAILRIADATEMMAKYHAELIKERDRFQRWYDGEVAENRELRKKISALKGHITRLKKTRVKT